MTTPKKTAAIGNSRAEGQCFFWFFSLRQRKEHIKINNYIIKN